MQAAQCLTPSILLPLQNSQNKCFLASSSSPSIFRFSSILHAKKYRSTPISTETIETSTVDYSSIASVFPAEACETIGGDACNVDMFPEVKLPQQLTNNLKNTVEENFDREYIDYSDKKTVFVEEACDDLGGEFCDPGYQRARVEPPY